ncbi:MAG TPA: hypothetical protein VGP97_18115 [Burkholderiales bacterium]|jgi:uncharacterized membrane protein|nr:hypothetical protein [Burkholderiales bacterium]
MTMNGMMHGMMGWMMGIGLAGWVLVVALLVTIAFLLVQLLGRGGRQDDAGASGRDRGGFEA